MQNNDEERSEREVGQNWEKEIGNPRPIQMESTRKVGGKN